MDVRSILSAVACIFVLASCSNNKSTDSVFPEKGAAGAAACQGQAIENKFVVEWEDGHFSVESAPDADEFERTFLEPQLEKIRYVQYDRIFQFQNSEEVRSSSLVDSWGQEMMKAPQLWSQGLTGQGVKVAVVDAFVDTSHNQIRPRIAFNQAEIPNNGIDDDKNGVVDDYDGAVFVSVPNTSPTPSSHGTHVAGIIAADHNHGSIQGVAPGSQIIPAQFIGNDGGGSLGDAILALQYSQKRGAKIINASWGGAPCDTALRNVFQKLSNDGILVVVAAGNSGRDIDSYPEYPAAFNMSTQITVAASSPRDFMTSWSNRGFQLVHIAAPGEDILSTVPGNSIAYMDGTSMAAPMVSGAAALLWSAHPAATATQIKDAILRSVDVYAGREFKVQTRGRINVQKALQILSQ